MNSRPDEETMNANIERDKNFRSKTKSVISNVGSLAAGGAIGSKILPFLSPYISEDIAMKGISKIAPKVGDFLKSGMAQGLSLKSGLDFLKENISPSKAENKVSKPNILDQYSPELKQFIEKKMEEGHSPIRAAGMARSEKKYKTIIDKIIEDHKLDKNFGFFNLLESLYDTGLAEDQSKAALQEPSQSQGIDPQLAQILEQGNALLQKFRGA